MHSVALVRLEVNPHRPRKARCYVAMHSVALVRLEGEREGIGATTGHRGHALRRACAIGTQTILEDEIAHH
jgi:hypothetical protein